jgi:hypothetical protein
MVKRPLKAFCSGKHCQLTRWSITVRHHYDKTVFFATPRIFSVLPLNDETTFESSPKRKHYRETYTLERYQVTVQKTATVSCQLRQFPLVKKKGTIKTLAANMPGKIADFAC